MKVTDASVPPNAAVLRTLDQTVRGLRTEMVDFTRELVAIVSENPPGLEYPAAVRVIEATLLRAHRCDRPRLAVCPGSGHRQCLLEVTRREALPPVRGGGMFVARQSARQAKMP